MPMSTGSPGPNGKEYQCNRKDPVCECSQAGISYAGGILALRSSAISKTVILVIQVLLLTWLIHIPLQYIAVIIVETMDKCRENAGKS